MTTFVVGYLLDAHHAMTTERITIPQRDFVTGLTLGIVFTDIIHPLDQI